MVANESLDLADTPAAASTEERTGQDWCQAVTEQIWAFKDAFVVWARSHLGESRVDYRRQSYIGVRYGRRVWAPLRPRKDGAYVYLPDPDGSRDQPSLAFEAFENELRTDGLTASWTTKYNAGANPIAIRLSIQDLQRRSVQSCFAPVTRRCVTARTCTPNRAASRRATPRISQPPLHARQSIRSHNPPRRAAARAAPSAYNAISAAALRDAATDTWRDAYEAHDSH